jgi:hypothetical protein
MVRRLASLGLPVLLAATLFPLAISASDAENAERCNGHPELCGRPYNQVVFAATHNSMSAADNGFVFPFQRRGIPRQLEDGIRMLLIDTHYWETPTDVAKVREHVPAERQAAFDAAIGEASPRRGPMLCHVLCGLGATPLDATLTDIRSFLDSHPREVVSIFFQDAVSAADTAAAFDLVGLTHYTYTHPDGTPWPTLGEMIRHGTRLVVLAEVEGPPPSWYQSGWKLAQDTSFTVNDPGQFTCTLNRGGATNELFLMNHWLAKGAPSRDDASVVNSYGFLLRRARKCARERGQLPNFIAVNFYDEGSLLAVVDRLNRVR